ncbi:Predicted arabinose efflux permease, MFS family [Haladaptatus litoreus]|uniref:Predicted arabinose efflux permease, MFS family n=1 Tax=Haladaptatus litoreus TaxID=553468 RepID=A0A1N7BGZ6_9EURY|nr:MFS transporter [Haladaptatus litoreus]SIR50669.1 Predicted arabinose efflux permease, MFS family [Haladaptatus litoreus]
MGEELVDGTQSASQERLVTGYSGKLLLAVSLGWAMIQTGRLVLSPMLPTVMESLRITEFQAGLAFTLLWGLYALGQYPSGRLSDHLSRKTLLATGLSLLVVGFGVLASAPTYAIFLLGAAVVGTGAGLYPTPARALVSDLFVSRRGQAFGLHGASGDAGGAVAAGLAIVVLAAATWRFAFLPVVLALVVVFVLLHQWNREAYTPPRIDATVGRAVLGDIRKTAGRFANRRTAALLVAYSLYAFVWQSVTGFLPTFLQEAKDFSPELAGGGFAVLFVVGALVKPLSGSLGDRISRPVVAAGSLVVATLALAGVILTTSTLAVTASVVVFSAGLMAYPPAMQAHLMDVFPDGSMGGDLGATRTIYIGLGSLGTTYVGFVAGEAGYTTAFAGLLVCLVVSASIVLGLAQIR